MSNPFEFNILQPSTPCKLLDTRNLRAKCP